jgi:hypothetical protein|tara:strand:+ start:492 stop:1040 length:549 start_codon:yes stop_codon:yes gene_type:complete
MPNSFVFALGFTLLAAAGLVLRWAFARWLLVRDAHEEYDERAAFGAVSVEGIEKAEFCRIYVSAHEPRWALYAALALLTAIVVTWPALQALLYIWDQIRFASGASDVFAPGYYPWMFFMFFGLVGAWAFCGWLAARVFHARAPEEFHAAILRAQGQPIDDVEIKRRRPKWARRAQMMREGKN